MGILFNRSNNISKNNPDDDIEDFKSLFEIKALDDASWDEEENSISAPVTPQKPENKEPSLSSVESGSDKLVETEVDVSGEGSSSQIDSIESKKILNAIENVFSVVDSPDPRIQERPLEQPESTPIVKAIWEISSPVHVPTVPLIQEEPVLTVKSNLTPDIPEISKGKKYALISSEQSPVRKLKGKNVVVLNNKGVALSRLGKYTEAIEVYDRALQLDPEYVSAWNNKGVVLSRLGKYAEAIEAFDSALRTHSANKS
jgi:tetratricopeptide (TPR) repeat protein